MSKINLYAQIAIFCQTPGLGLRLGVDFVFPLSQEQEQQEQQPPPKSKLEFDTKDQVLCVPGTVGLKDRRTGPCFVSG